ncbi:MAG: ABC transporter ATP-binding protein [Candidatus Omnitrophota bacterium]
MILEAKNLSVSYQAKTRYVNALKEVSWGVNQGEILAIVGESGSGKSTLALSILNLLPPNVKSQGEIIFQGRNIFKLEERESEALRGNKIGLIFQEPASSFNPVLSINYQFNEILKNKLSVKFKAVREKIIFDSLDQARVREPERILNSYPHQLSGGQLQRVAIAMAVAYKPAVLIADEPTSSLDVTIESQIVHLFKELRDKLKLTIIFITHNLDLVRALCDRVVVLYQGEVREIKGREALFNNPEDDYTKRLLTSFKDLEE